MNWFYKLIALIMTLFIHFPVGEIASYSTVDENASLVFTVVSDVHIEGNNKDRFALFGEGLADINSTKRNDALVFLGDNTMNNQVVELGVFYELLTEHITIPNILMVTGNHDLCPSDYNTGDYEDLRERFFAYKNEYIKTPYDDRVYYSYEIKGYKFIVLGTESDAGVQEDISDEQFAWLESELKNAEESEKAVFIFNHFPLNNTWADVWPEGHIGEDSDRLYNLFTQCENRIYYFSGHLHMGLFEDWRGIITDGNITFINVPSFGSENNAINADIKDVGLGLQVEVYKDPMVIRSRNFAKHEWTNIEYEFKW